MNWMQSAFRRVDRRKACRHRACEALYFFAWSRPCPLPDAPVRERTDHLAFRGRGKLVSEQLCVKARLPRLRKNAGFRLF